MDIKGFLFSLIKPSAPSGSVNLPFQVDVNGPNTCVSVSAPILVGDSGSGGAAGLAPAPAAGDGAAKKWLKATGAWLAIVASDLAGAVFGASGASHSAGAVPDPGSSAGTTRYLREDSSWAVPPDTGITQLIGDVTAGPGSGSQAASVVKVNGLAVPASATFIGTNSSRQFVAATVIRKVVLVVDGGGSAPATGAVKRFVQVDFAGTIVGWAAFGDPSGSVSVDVWKKAGTAPPTATAPILPTSSDKISASAPVAISSAQSAAGGASAISTWTTAVAAGDTFGFSIASVSTIAALTVELYIQQI